MKRWTHRLVSGLIAATATAGLLTAVPMLAAAVEPVDCSQEAQAAGSKMSVVLVHGLFSNIGIWGDPQNNEGTMHGTLGTLSEVHRVRFDYSSNFNNIKWVTDPNVGPKLAETVTCLADASKKNGGPGKVAIIGHSMGGLVAQYAAAQVPDKVGPVITIATPHKGSILGNAATSVINSLCSFAFPLKGTYEKYVTKENCSKSLAFGGLSIGSKELEELLPFPTDVSVKAIAGNITPQMRLGMLTITGEPLDSDAVVHVPSALGKFTTFGKGDGKKEVSCTGFLVFASMSDASCEHSRIVNDPTVQQEVKASIEQYLASTQKKPVPPGKKVTLFNKLALTYLGTWKQGFSTPGTMEDIVDGTNCTAGVAECPHIMIVNLDSPEARTEYGSNPMAKAAHSCMLEQDESGHKPGQQPRLLNTEMVDGESVEHYEQVVCPSYLGSDEKAYFWYAKKRGILIDASSVGLTGSPLALDQLKAVVAGIEWL